MLQLENLCNKFIGPVTGKRQNIINRTVTKTSYRYPTAAIAFSSSTKLQVQYETQRECKKKSVTIIVQVISEIKA